MAGQFPKSVIVEFDKMVEGFEPNNIMAKQAEIRNRSGKGQFQSNFREWQVIEQISTTVDGLDITAQLGRTLSELAIPYDIDTIPNVPFTLTAQELLDEGALRKKMKSAFKALSARINRDVANAVATQGALTVIKSGNLAGYADIADCESAMIRIDCSDDAEKTMILNVADYAKLSGNLADREFISTGKTLTAYEKSKVGVVAGFDTFRTSFTPVLQVAGGGATTVNGAQSHVPVSSQAATNGNMENVDNRFFDLVVDNTVGVTAGDRFTAGVNEVSMINKQDTGHLRAFTVVEVVDGTTLRISPAPVAADGATQAEKEYANVTTELANAQALTWLNIAEKPTNIFFENDCVSINAGNLAVEAINGLSIARGETDSGILIIMASDGVLGSLSGQYRLLAFYGVTVKDPHRAGVLLANQT